MATPINCTLKLKITPAKPEKRNSNNIKKISKECRAVVIKHEGEWKARVKSETNEDCTDLLVIPFTEDSLSLKGKTFVFLKNKDEHGKHVCIIKTTSKANLNPGIEEQYDVLKEGLLISGWIVSIDKKHYFQYNNLIAYTEYGAKINYIEDNKLII